MTSDLPFLGVSPAAFKRAREAFDALAVLHSGNVSLQIREGVDCTEH